MLSNQEYYAPMLEEEERMMAQADTQEGPSRQEAAQQDSGTTAGGFWALMQGPASGATPSVVKGICNLAVTLLCRRPPGPGGGGC